MSTLIRVNGPIRHKIRTLDASALTALPVKEYNRTTNVYTGVSFGGGSFVPHTETSEISYTCHSKTNRNAANWCKHTRITKDCSGSTSGVRNDWPSHDVYYLWDSTAFYGKDDVSVAVGAAKTAFGVNLGSSVLATSGQGFINEAIDKLRPDLTMTSVPNFIIDLEQLKDLATSVRDAWNLTVASAELLGKVRAEVLMRVKSDVKGVAAANLAWNFGWRPTYGDVRGIISGMFGLLAKLDAFQQQCNIPQKRYMTSLKTSLVKTGTATVADHSIPWIGKLNQQVISFFVYKPLVIQEINTLRLILRGLLDSLGFEINPRIIWDALPFSFVVDWFVGVGNYLNAFKVDTLELPIAFVDSYLQLTEDITVGCTPYITCSSDQVPHTIPVGGWSQHEHTFMRLPLLPDYSTLSSLHWKRPSTKQLLLGLSLVAVFAL